MVSAELEAKTFEALGALISNIKRADGKNWRDAFENGPAYLQALGLAEQLKHTRVLHIAGTKGKGSTAAFAASILRACGYSVGLFTSPHLCDVRERIRIDGDLVAKDTFHDTFWRCHSKLRAVATDTLPMPGYFRFLTYLAFTIFLEERLDVIVLEVGLGGRLDATNVVPAPVATAVTTLDYDHVELLGDTLDLIAREKAGIFRAGVPAITCAQEPEAMAALRECAEQTGCELSVAPSLAQLAGAPDALGLPGDVQRKNADIATQLCLHFDRFVAEARLGGGAEAAPPPREGAGGAAVGRNAPNGVEDGESAAAGGDPRCVGWQLVPAQQEGARARVAAAAAARLPGEYRTGLEKAEFPGRAQVAIVPVGALPADEDGSAAAQQASVAFFLDGAHTPASMEACAAWFAQASGRAAAAAGAPEDTVDRVVLFNCMATREPATLLQPLARLPRRAAPRHALFVPPQSQYSSVVPSDAPRVDVSWQQASAEAWERLQPPRDGAPAPLRACFGHTAAHTLAASSVHASLHGALARMRAHACAPAARPLHVLVTGSLHLVGDVLRLLGRAPS